MKGLIIAAGRGMRLKDLTRDTPKTLLNVGGITILQRMINSMNDSGIFEIGLVRGYLAEKFDVPSIKYFENRNFENNNVLQSLMCAREFLTKSVEEGVPVILTYSDIVVDKAWIQSAKSLGSDITLLCDSNWKSKYIGRDQNPMTDAELAVFDTKNNLCAIGKIYDSLQEAGRVNLSNTAEFVGICLLNPNGILKVINTFDDLNRSLGPTDKFGNSSEFQKAYLTDLFQFMILAGERILVETAKYPWFEIDTAQDLARANEFFSTGNQL